MQIPKLSLFFSSIDSLWFLFFWRFKNTFYRKGKCIYIYIYMHIMIAILSNIRRFDAINASNQRTICSCMIFQPLCFKLAIFSINSIVFYEIFYNDVTASCDFIMMSHICSPIMMKFVQHTYVKLNSKHNLFMRIFYLRFIFRDNYDYRFYIYTYIVALMQ